MKSFISLLGFLSELGDINIFKIFLFSSSCIGLAARLIGFGDTEPGLEPTEERLRIEGFRMVNLLRKLLGVGLEGTSVEVGLSSNSAMSEVNDIWCVKKLPQPKTRLAFDKLHNYYIALGSCRDSSKLFTCS